MLSPIIGKRRKNKRFSFKPRYYKPEPRKQGSRIRFKRITRRGQAGSVIFFAALLALVIWILV